MKYSSVHFPYLMSSEFSLLVKEKRKQNYATARQFFLKNSIPCTYQYYAKIESGSLPNIDLALNLIETLKLDLRLSLFAWMRDNLDSPSKKALFSQIDHSTTWRETNNPNPNKTLIVNRMQAKLLNTDQIYWELLTYVSNLQDRKKVSPENISKNFNMPIGEVNDLLRNLYDYGLVETFAKDSVTTREWIFIPYDDEFVETRDKNLKRAFEQFWKVPQRDRYRTTITCLMDPEIKEIFEAKVIALTNELITLSRKLEEKEQKNKSYSKESVPYTVGVFASQRKFGVK